MARILPNVPALFFTSRWYQDFIEWREDSEVLTNHITRIGNDFPALLRSDGHFTPFPILNKVYEAEATIW